MSGDGVSLIRSWVLNACRIRAGMAFAVLLLILCWGLLDPVACSGEFFRSLWLPALWAVAAVSLLASGFGMVRVFGIAALFLPVIATHVHYAVAMASHGSFLFAGILPWSDAYMHFVQAAQMAQDGFTARPFNGRFLYPGFFSSMLRLCGFNMQVAQVLVGVIFTGGLYVSVRSLIIRAGIAGTLLFALLIWLYWRDHGASLVMTEQLGLILGLLALPLLLSMCGRKSMVMLLGALLLLAVGFSARPGALFVLPMLVLFSGWTGWSGWIFPRIPALTRALASVLIAVGVCGAGLEQPCDPWQVPSEVPSSLTGILHTP